MLFPDRRQFLLDFYARVCSLMLSSVRGFLLPTAPNSYDDDADVIGYADGDDHDMMLVVTIMLIMMTMIMIMNDNDTPASAKAASPKDEVVDGMVNAL